MLAVSLKAAGADAFVVAVEVVAVRVVYAGMRSAGALVDVPALVSDSLETCLTPALVRAGSVPTPFIRSARVFTCSALVYVFTRCLTVTNKAFATGATVSIGDIAAICVFVAVKL